MFHFPTSPPHRLCIHLQVTPHNWCWVSPFGHPRINALLATPRGLTQPHTSFIGPACQGIHHTPVTQNNNYGRYKNCRHSTNKNYTKRTRCSRPLYSSHTTHTPRRPTTTTDDQPTMECHKKEHTMLPQTPNSMPTHHQFHCCIHALDIHAPKRAHPTTTPHTHFKHHDHGWVCLHPDIFKTNWWQYHTRALNHHTHNCGPQISSLERR